MLDDGDGAPEANVKDRVRVAEAEVGEGTRCECVASCERQVIELADALEQGGDLCLVSDVQGRSHTAVRQFVKRRGDPFLSA